MSTYHRPRADLLHWQGQKLPGDGIQDHLWENLPELVGPEPSQTHAYARKTPTLVRIQNQTSLYLQVSCTLATISSHQSIVSIYLQYLGNHLAVYLTYCWSLYYLPSIPNYIFLSVAWKTTTTAVTQTMRRGHGATPLTQRNAGSSARSPHVMLVRRWVCLSFVY